MMTFLKELLMLPTWIAAHVVVIHFLPLDHPLKNEKIDLKRWTKEATPELIFFSVVFWLFGAALIYYITL